VSALVLSLFLGFPLAAQTPLKFENVSVTRGRPDRGVKGGCHGIDSVLTPHQMADAPPLGQCVITDARLSHLLIIAFGFGWIEPLVGGPDWARNGGFRYNVAARVDEPSSATEEQLLDLLQKASGRTLLCEIPQGARRCAGFRHPNCKRRKQAQGIKGGQAVCDFQSKRASDPERAEIFYTDAGDVVLEDQASSVRQRNWFDGLLRLHADLG